MMEFSYAAIEEERNCFVITTFEDINSLSKFNICTKCKNLIIDYPSNIILTMEATH